MSFCISYGTDWLVTALKRNELVELRLGWHESGGLPNHRALAKALKSNTSLRRISIGWHWQAGAPNGSREFLFQILVTIAESLRPQQLQSIQLVLNDSIPYNVLEKLLRSQTCLSCIDLQVVTVQKTPWKGLTWSSFGSSNKQNDSLRSNDSASTTGTFSMRSTSSISNTSKEDFRKQHLGKKHKVANVDIHQRTTTLVPLLVDALSNHHQYDVLSELRLVDCDLNDDAAFLLSQELLTTSFLSVRSNRRLTGRGAAALIPAAKRLDLSLCDFAAPDFIIISQALRQRQKKPMQELHLCGNYRMDLVGLEALMDIAPLVVETMDISFCELSETMTVHILERLIELGQQLLRLPSKAAPHVRLRDLTMRGSRIGSADAVRALTLLLQQNAPPLRRLVANDDKNDKKYVCHKHLELIADSMQHNYEMEHLIVDFFKGSKLEQAAWNRVEYWQRLNRAGRRLLLSHNSSRDSTLAGVATKCDHKCGSGGNSVDMARAMRVDLDDWILLLSNVKAVNSDLDSIYWVVRNSAERFRR